MLIAHATSMMPITELITAGCFCKIFCRAKPAIAHAITPEQPTMLRIITKADIAMLEFGTVYLDFPLFENQHPDNTDWGKYAHNKYSYLNEYDKPLGSDVYESRQLVTTNYRVLIEHGWLDDLKYLCEPTEYHEKRVCVKFVTDRGVANELVRHRTFSFAQESSRYCSYNKDKFGNELTFIIPTWSNLEPADHDGVTAQLDAY